MAKYVRDTSAGKSIRAIVILKGSRLVATVQTHFGNTGNVLVNIWQESEAYKRCAMRDGETLEHVAYDKYAFQQGSAGGYGYDKEAAALSGLMIDGHELGNHCQFRRKPPKGRFTWPNGAKPPKGWSFANFATISRITGRRVDSHSWRSAAMVALGIDENDHDAINARWDEIKDKAYTMETEWLESDDCEQGYTDCYREPGLKYLTALGYRIINAI